MSVQAILALDVAIVAAVMDIMSEKVANRLIYAAWILGLGYQLGMHQLRGIGCFLGGTLFPIVLLFPLFMFRMLGPGDIKVFSALGGIMGSMAVLKCILISIIFGGILSVAFICVCGNLISRLRYFTDYITDFLETRQRKPYYITGAQVENIHFTVPILMGVMLFAGGMY